MDVHINNSQHRLPAWKHLIHVFLPARLCQRAGVPQNVLHLHCATLWEPNSLQDAQEYAPVHGAKVFARERLPSGMPYADVDGGVAVSLPLLGADAEYNPFDVVTLRLAWHTTCVTYISFFYLTLIKAYSDLHAKVPKPDTALPQVSLTDTLSRILATKGLRNKKTATCDPATSPLAALTQLLQQSTSRPETVERHHQALEAPGSVRGYPELCAAAVPQPAPALPAAPARVAFTSYTAAKCPPLAWTRTSDPLAGGSFYVVIYGGALLPPLDLPVSAIDNLPPDQTPVSYTHLTLPTT